MDSDGILPVPKTCHSWFLFRIAQSKSVKYICSVVCGNNDLCSIYYHCCCFVFKVSFLCHSLYQSEIVLKYREPLRLSASADRSVYRLGSAFKIQVILKFVPIFMFPWDFLYLYLRVLLKVLLLFQVWRTC